MAKSFVLWVLQLDDTWFLGNLLFPHMGWVLLATLAAGGAAVFLAGGRLQLEYAISCLMEILVIKFGCWALIIPLYVLCIRNEATPARHALLEALVYLLPIALILFKEGLFRGDWSKPSRPGFRYVPRLTVWRMARKNFLFAVSGILTMADMVFDELAVKNDIIVKGPYWLCPLLIELALLVFFLDTALGIGLSLSGVRLVSASQAQPEQAPPASDVPDA